MLRFEGKIAPAHQESINEVYHKCLELLNNEEFYNQEIVVTYNHRLRTTAGRVGWNPGFQAWKVDLNPKYHQEFGLERMMGTLRHELAHIASWTLYRDLGHTKNFKRICELFGGTMNPRMAGTKYKSASTDQYLKAPPKLRYTCPNCGETLYLNKKVSGKRYGRGICSKCKAPVIQFTIERSI